MSESFELYDLKIEVVAPEGAKIWCGAKPGDHFVLQGEMLTLPPGQGFSIYSLAAVLPLLAAKQRVTASIAKDTVIAGAADQLIIVGAPRKQVIIGTDIQAVIAEMGPLPGAREFVEWVREHFQLIILSDTFYEFAHPLMRQLGWPTIMCHKLEVSAEGRITNYLLRQPDQKRMAVKSLHALNYKVVAAGDSYNDTGMLSEADKGILFDAPANVIREFPQFPVTTSYEELKNEIRSWTPRQIG